MRAKLLMWAAVVLVILSALFLVRHSGTVAERQATELRTAKTALSAAQQDLADYQASVAEVNKLASKRREEAARIQTVTKELIREVPVRVPADACPLPDGWRVQHDEAAAGTAPDTTAPGRADGGPVAAQEAAVTVTENYGQYHDLADRHRRLQQYVKEQLNAGH